jgi:hypothetical protein
MRNALGLATKHIDTIWETNQTGLAQDGRELTAYEQEKLRQCLTDIPAAFKVACGDERLEPGQTLHEITERLIGVGHG